MLTLNANVTFFTVNVNGSSNPSLPLPTFQASTHISVSIKPKPGFAARVPASPVACVWRLAHCPHRGRGGGGGRNHQNKFQNIYI